MRERAQGEKGDDSIRLWAFSKFRAHMREEACHQLVVEVGARGAVYFGMDRAWQGLRAPTTSVGAPVFQKNSPSNLVYPF